MSLKYQLETLDGVEESVKGLYTEKDGKFVLGIEGLPDVSEYEQRVTKMDAKINELLGEKKAAQKKADDAAEAARLAAEEAARKGGDIEAVEKSLRDKFGKELKSVADAKEAAEKQLSNVLVKKQALEIASRNAVDNDSAAILSEWIEHRTEMEMVDGEYRAVFKGPDGKRSGLNADEFEESLVSEKSLARLLKASKASGGGAKGNKGGGAAKKTITRAEYDAMEPEARQKLIVEDGVRIAE